MRKLLNEYKEFISQGNVMAIAVALVMALYFKSIVDAVINGVIMPIVSAIVGEESFEDIGFGIGDTFISIGLVIQAVIMFLIVAFVLFLIVKAYNSYVAKPQEEGPSELDTLHGDPRRATTPADSGFADTSRRLRPEVRGPTSPMKRFRSADPVVRSLVCVEVQQGTASARSDGSRWSSKEEAPETMPPPS